MRDAALKRCVVVVVVLAACLLQAAGQGGGQVEEEEMTEEQIHYYRTVLETYDTDHDGLISMDENLEQDKIIAADSGKPFDEVQPPWPAFTIPRRSLLAANPASVASSGDHETHACTTPLLVQPLLREGLSGGLSVCCSTSLGSRSSNLTRTRTALCRWRR